MTKNHKHEFKLVLTDVELTEEQQDRVSRAVAQAGVMALGDLLPKDSLTVPVRRNVWWYGIPRPDLMTDLQTLAAEREMQ